MSTTTLAHVPLMEHEIIFVGIYYTS